MATSTSRASTPLTPNAAPHVAPQPYEPMSLQLDEHFRATYFMMRWGMAALGIALPLLLTVLAGLRGVGLQGSMSAYYYAGNGVVRDIFVGVLVAIGALLILYRGFSRAENVALNIAGVLAVVIAMVPMQWQCGNSCTTFSVHGVAAVLFFLCIAYVCWFRADDTVDLLETEKERDRYKRAYKSIGTLMIISPLAALTLNAMLQRQGRESLVVLLIEAFGVWVFAAYWVFKSRELKKTSAEELALRDKVKREKRHKRLWFDDARIVRT